MTTTDYSALDRPDIAMNAFYPRRNRTPTPAGAQDFALPVAEDISLSCRFFPVAQGQPTILFFYGNGETAADYDNIAPIYNQVGVNFFVADYRGYGQSGGLPTFSSDAVRRPPGAGGSGEYPGGRRLRRRVVRDGPLHGPPRRL